MAFALRKVSSLMSLRVTVAVKGLLGNSSKDEGQGNENAAKQ